VRNLAQGLVVDQLHLVDGALDRAARVVTAPFGPTAVSLRRDGLLQDGADAGSAGSVDWAPAASDAANAIDAQVRITRTRFRMEGPSTVGTSRGAMAEVNSTA